jgi:hypothetical protein
MTASRVAEEDVLSTGCSVHKSIIAVNAFASVGSRLRISVQGYGWVKQGMIYPFVDYIDR